MFNISIFHNEDKLCEKREWEEELKKEEQKKLKIKENIMMWKKIFKN